MDPLDRADPDPRRLLADYRAGERMPPALREVAWLRLLLRKAASQLSDKWRLRREGDGHVDLLIIHDLEDPASVPMPLESGQRRLRLPGVHVLLVDDSDINLEVATRLLQREGAEVITAIRAAWAGLRRAAEVFTSEAEGGACWAGRAAGKKAARNKVANLLRW